jgi:IS30 family transposase
MKKSYNHLSRAERYEIKDMRNKGVTITEIAKTLNRSKGTISMEIRRNK